jgi:hypothetical protein
MILQLKKSDGVVNVEGDKITVSVTQKKRGFFKSRKTYYDVDIENKYYVYTLGGLSPRYQWVAGWEFTDKDKAYVARAYIVDRLKGDYCKIDVRFMEK